MKITGIAAIVGASLLLWGCRTLLNDPYNWTAYFSRHPEAMARYPGYASLQLGAVYELKQDMLLVRSMPRNRFDLDLPGASGPTSFDAYLSRPDHWKKYGYVGLLEAGTLIRADRVESYTKVMVTTIEGITYRVETGQHAGKLLMSSGFGFMPPSWQEGERNFGFFAIPDPEYLKLVRPAYLDAAGRPLPEVPIPSLNSTFDNRTNAVPGHVSTFDNRTNGE